MARKFSKKYIVEDNSGGSLRFYLRKKGHKKVRLPGVPGSDEFNEAYYSALERLGQPEAKEHNPLFAKPNTLRWLCEQYFSCAEYRRLADRTQYVRRQILESCWLEPIAPGSERIFGDFPLPAFTAKSARVLRDRKAETPEAANSRLKALRQVFAWATLPHVDLAQHNPMRDIPYFKSTGTGHHTWSIAEIEQFEARHPIGSKARLAMTLMLYTSQRRSDIVLFGRQHIREGWFRFTQQKNKRSKPITLELPVHPELQKAIDATPGGNLTFLVTEFDKPFTANGFGNWFRKRCDEADLPHCAAHGLRKAAATRLADNGATEHEIMSVTGHQTSKEVTRYTKAANQKRLAQGAMHLLDKQETAPKPRTKVSKI